MTLSAPSRGESLGAVSVLLQVEIDFHVPMLDRAIDSYVDWETMTVNAAADLGEVPGWSNQQRSFLGGRYGVKPPGYQEGPNECLKHPDERCYHYGSGPGGE